MVVFDVVVYVGVVFALYFFNLVAFIILVSIVVWVFCDCLVGIVFCCTPNPKGSVSQCGPQIRGTISPIVLILL